MEFNVTVWFLCFVVNSVLIDVNVVFTYSSMLSTSHTSMSSTVVLTSLKVFHENIQCYIQYISYQDVTYDLFLYLSDSLLN